MKDETAPVLITTPDDGAPIRIVADGSPMKIALDRAEPVDPLVFTDRLATFRRFEKYLRANGNTKAGNPWKRDDPGAYAPPFTDKNYRQLVRLAQDYARSIRVDSLAALAGSYLRGRARADATLPKLVQRQIMGYFPGVELIWNFWQESGMLVQTLNLILARFQNRVTPGGYSPLDRFDLTPLAPLHALIYAFVDDEQHRMTVRRRAAEYEYEYGLKLIGKAIPPSSTIVERRSGFLEKFHQVLYLAHIFFKEDDDLTVRADAFPLWTALRDCHLELSGGSHNQYGQMAVNARAEFLEMQFLLAQPEMHVFLGGKPMTPYPEPWMDRVDRMKDIQSGWPAASVMHFNDLARIGERLVLTIRLGSWADGANTDADTARGWAALFRGEIQQYVAAYRSVTGVDLSREPNATQPATLIWQRAQEQRLRA
jgi:hypothetical protein